MVTRWHLAVVAVALNYIVPANSLPYFVNDLNNLPLSEATPVGTIVYTLEFQNADEDADIKFGIRYTDKFIVDPDTGDIRLAKPLDREVEEVVRFEALLLDGSLRGEGEVIQALPVTVIVLDENDNAPTFKNSPYEVDVSENESVGATVLHIKVEDRDSFGDNLEVSCTANEKWPEACDIFEVETVSATANQYKGVLVLKKPLEYSEKQFYQFQLSASDGAQVSSADVEVRVVDVQNLPPVVGGALSAALPEDAPVGTAALTLRATDPDRAQPRQIVFDLLTNPLDYFELDRHTGELRTAKPLDREALADPSSPLNLTIRATEVVDGVPVISDTTSTTALVTVSILDVNDEPPRFNRREYHVEIPESLPVGTPLPNLDMVVTDTDLGVNSEFGLHLIDNLDAFIVEPAEATGSATVTLRLNKSLDYEDPNQRKFILEVIAEETRTSRTLWSKASVTVSLRDVNDNAPVLEPEPRTHTVSETAPAGTYLFTLTATDRDTGRFGTEGIVYALSGNGADLFNVDLKSGVITVADCPTPGRSPCLDYETRKDFFLQYTATDEEGEGQSSIVPVHLSVTDANDNPPIFPTAVYKASIDEDAVKFEPELQVQARDIDESSELRYAITSPAQHPFLVDPVSGRITVRPDGELATHDANKIVLTVAATDGVFNATCLVEITVRDVNNHEPVFDFDKYDADIAEDAPIGTQVAAVRATDKDSGMNAQLKYSIQKGAYDAFAIDRESGVVTVYSQLDYDKKNIYKIQIIASDMGMPSLTGTTELTVNIRDVNDKKPHFTPPTQRAEVSAVSELGTVVHYLQAEDPDVTNKSLLVFQIDKEKPIKAVDRNGVEVTDEGIFGSWFTVQPNGSVVVSQHIEQARAAVLSLPLLVTDTSAAAPQHARGELIITIIDVNRHAPTFSQRTYAERMSEEQPVGTVLNTYSATDRDSPIAAILIHPPSPFFHIDNNTGEVKTSQRIDYEKTHTINFTLVATDSGEPPLSTSATVFVEILNVNDEEPVFSTDSYYAVVKEHVSPGTKVITVNAVDRDEGEFGVVRYSLSGEMASLFTIDPVSGVISVAPGAVIDREAVADIWLRAVATDQAPPHLAKSTSVPIHITVEDINDNPPIFSQKAYISTIAENLRLDPPAAILQVRAEDRDDGVNGKLKYDIVQQSEPEVFTVDSNTGIIYPAGPVQGGTTYRLTVRASDGLHSDTARVDIAVTTVNRHSPVFTAPQPTLRNIDVPENAAQADYLITKFEAKDEDSGDNGRVSYYLKVDNQNVGETAEFSLNPDTGELRTKTFLDREHKAEYQLVVAAVDHGSPQHETLRLLTVTLADHNDNAPRFLMHQYTFTVRENLPPQIIIGTVKATDKDTGENAQVYYHILDGNHEGAITLSKTSGVIKANISFDREKQAEYFFTVYASNNPLLEKSAAVPNSVERGAETRADIAAVTIRVLDENDNEPKFERQVYYTGVLATARVNEALLPVVATDPDLAENGTLVYLVAASNLYKFGAAHPSGSVVPSPFNITQEGVLMTASYMSEYNQDRFVLDIIAQEIAPPHRQAKAQVYVWIIDRSSLVRLIVSRRCSAPAPVSRLAAAARVLLVPAARLPHVHADTRYDDWCEIHLHAVDPETYQVLPVEKVLETIDSKYDQLKDVYQEFGVETLVAASASTKAPDAFDPALAALIALLIVLFTGIVTFVVVCACLKHWVIAPHSMQSSKGDSLGRRRILEELSTTENPLWLETKLRPYEEQELTMNVFGDQQEFNTEPVQPDNTYATIQGSRTTERFGDYATLGGESPTPLEAALGFQGSTFKPPSADTPEPPPRPSNGLAQL